MESAKRYYLYDYLMYFWKKKGWLIGIPVIAVLLVAGLSFLTAKGYEGKGEFYISSPDKDGLTDPDLLIDSFEEEYGVKAEVVGLGKSKVRITLHGDNQNEVKEDLAKIVNWYDQALQDNYKVRKVFTEETIKNSENRLESVEKSYKSMSRLQDSPDEMANGESAHLSEAVANSEELIEKYDSDIKNSEKDLLFFEEPKVLSETVEKEDNNMLANAIIAFVFSLFLTMLGLMLAKYIRDAKKEIRND